MKNKRRLCALLATVLFAATGCGPILSTSRRADAEDAIAKAQNLNAAERAPYEYTLAVEYLHKADELWGYSKFGDSANYAAKAIEMANAAAEKAESEPWTSPLKNAQ